MTVFLPTDKQYVPMYSNIQNSIAVFTVILGKTHTN